LQIKPTLRPRQMPGPCVFLQEAPRTACMPSDIPSLVQESCFLRLKAWVQRVTGFDTIMPCAKLELEYLPDSKRIASAIVLTLGY
jgi:pyruvate dehydrogenase E1 component beta subunit